MLLKNLKEVLTLILINDPVEILVADGGGIPEVRARLVAAATLPERARTEPGLYKTSLSTTVKLVFARESCPTMPVNPDRAPECPRTRCSNPRLGKWPATGKRPVAFAFVVVVVCLNCKLPNHIMRMLRKNKMSN